MASCSANSGSGGAAGSAHGSGSGYSSLAASVAVSAPVLSRDLFDPPASTALPEGPFFDVDPDFGEGFVLVPRGERDVIDAMIATLPNKQAALLSSLSKHPGRWVHRDTLILNMWDVSEPETAVESLRVMVSKVRRKLADHGWGIEVSYNRGCRVVLLAPRERLHIGCWDQTFLMVKLPDLPAQMARPGVCHTAGRFLWCRAHGRRGCK